MWLILNIENFIDSVNLSDTNHKFSTFASLFIDECKKNGIEINKEPDFQTFSTIYHKLETCTTDEFDGYLYRFSEMLVEYSKTDEYPMVIMCVLKQRLL